MSKPSRRPNRELIKAQRKRKKEAEKELRARQESEGLTPSSNTTTSNCKSEFQTVEEEREARCDTVTEQVMIFRSKLPILLKRLSQIDDPRNPKKIKHKLTVLMIYGILTFVYQMASRREANREMSRPVFTENLKLLFPELESLPHHDTLMRILSRIEVDEIEATHIELVRKLIRKKKFMRYLIDHCYPIAIDGTQKFARNWLWSEECLERKDKTGDGEGKQYYVYVLEANLAFHDGMSIPLMSEVLNYAKGDTAKDKQDCELKAFYRLANRLKKEFPNLAIMVLLDGLYAKGPVIELCRKKKWQFMIVLQDKCLKSVWEEYEGLSRLEKNNEFFRTWADRRQHFYWVNNIYYYYGPKERKKQIVHVVVCEESWEEVDQQSAEIVTKHARHAWLSSKPLNKWNVHERCNLAARHRWGIESGILVEKCHGYQYEHCFSYNWNAMKGYHYLMRLAHMINVLAQYSECLVKMFNTLGVRGFIRFVRQTIAAPWLDPLLVKKRLAHPFQLRLI
ncbi:MAG: transposase family protein [Deltaproteobacteria bacterium]|nr:transposase family protein [Deltaproteobacteria bacterium]